MYAKEKGGESRPGGSNPKVTQKNSLKNQIAAQAKAYRREDDPQEIKSAPDQKKAGSLKDQIAAQAKARERQKILSLPEEIQGVARIFEARVLGEEPDGDSFESHRKAVEEGYRATSHLWYPRKKGQSVTDSEDRHGPAKFSSVGPGRIERVSQKERDRARVRQSQVGLFSSEGSGRI